MGSGRRRSARKSSRQDPVYRHMRVLQDYCSEKVSDFVQYFIRATTVFIHNLAERRGNAADGDVPVVLSRLRVQVFRAEGLGEGLFLACGSGGFGF